MTRQDVVAVVADVAVEIDLDGPEQAVIGSDRMVAIDSDRMAAINSTMVRMRNSKWVDVEGDTVSKVVSLRAIDGQTVMRWKQVQKVDSGSQVASHLIRITPSGLSSAVQRKRIASS
jgi:hypothetical protein